MTEIRKLYDLKKEFASLIGVAEGPKVASLLEEINRLMVNYTQWNVNGSVYELVLSIANDVCPYMFSSDTDVVKQARLVMANIGKAIVKGDENDDNIAIQKTLKHLEVTTLFTLSVKHVSEGMRINFTGEDVYSKVGNDTSFFGRDQLPVQLLLEDLDGEAVNVIAEKTLFKQAAVEFSTTVETSAEAAANKLFTVLAGGQEIFRTTLGSNKNLIFVL